jgi:hypothetical protein
VKLGDAVVRDLKVDEDFGNDANDATAESERGLCDGLHEADVRSTVDDADVALCELTTKLVGSVAICGI